MLIIKFLLFLLFLIFSIISLYFAIRFFKLIFLKTEDKLLVEVAKNVVENHSQNSIEKLKNSGRMYTKGLSFTKVGENKYKFITQSRFSDIGWE